MHHIKYCIQKYIKKKSETNPFQDIKIIHEDRGRLESISVSLDSVEELDISALESTVAELISAELVKTHCINISKTVDQNQVIHYVGRIEVVDDEEKITLDSLFVEDS